MRNCKRWSTLVVFLVVAAGCGGGGETAQTVTLLTEDGPTEIVVSTTTTTTTTTTTVAPTTTEIAEEATASETSVVEEATASETSVVEEATASETSVAEEPAVEATTTTTTTTTTVEPAKETIPLAEEEIHPGIRMMDAVEEFNGCLSDEGVAFIGQPNPELGAGDPVNQPAYIDALVLCAGRSGIVAAMQEFQTSRTGRTPDQIREDNEQFIAMLGCLRQKGWVVSDPVPDEEGSLGPGDDFRGPDGDLDMDDIRDCISELSLNDDQ